MQTAEVMLAQDAMCWEALERVIALIRRDPKSPAVPEAIARARMLPGFTASHYALDLAVFEDLLAA